MLIIMIRIRVTCFRQYCDFFLLYYNFEDTSLPTKMWEPINCNIFFRIYVEDKQIQNKGLHKNQFVIFYGICISYLQAK